MKHWRALSGSAIALALALFASMASSAGAVELATLSVQKAGTGNGLVISNPAGISCGATCSAASADFPLGSTVTLNVDTSGSVIFTGWSGGGCSGTGTCTVTMDAAKTVTANFDSGRRTLTLQKAGKGDGFFVSNPAGISCGPGCRFASADFPLGSSVTFNPDVNGISVFAGWSGGGCTGVGSCTVAMDAAVTVTANIDSTGRTLTIQKTGAGTGVVVSSPAGISCGAACGTAAAEFAVGASVTLNADPAGSDQFTGWSGGGCSGTGTCTVTMDVAKTVGANFEHFVVLTVTGTTGAGSLPALLGTLNGACPSAGARIQFNIPANTDPGCDGATGICYLDVPGDITVRCSNVEIDGYSQPGASPNSATDHSNNAKIRIELTGGGIGPTVPRATRDSYFTIQGEPTVFGSPAVLNFTLRGIALPRHQLVLTPHQAGSALYEGGGHVVSGNYFGWHANGTRVSDAFSGGVRLYGGFMSNVRIGGPNPADRNLFSFRDPVECCPSTVNAIDGMGITGATVEGNYINVDPAGVPVATGGIADGITLSGSGNNGIPYSERNLIRHNVVAYPGGFPLNVGFGPGNTITENVLFGQPQGYDGILAFTFVAGGNAQEFPAISSVLIRPDGVLVRGTVTGTANATERIEFFHNSVFDFLGDGRAEEFVTHIDVPLPASGVAPFEVTLPAFVRNVEATATNLVTGDSSALSEPYGVAVLEVSPVTLAFGPQVVGTVSARQSVTITNHGFEAISLTLPTPAGDFVRFTDGCPNLVLQLDDTCVIDVAFAPTAIGSRTGALTVQNSAGLPVEIALAGTGLADAMAPTAVLKAPATGKVGVALTLDGASSFDIAGSVVQYRWSATERPTGSTVLPGPVVTTAPTLAITPDKLGRYIVQLVVVDDSGNQSAPDSATIIVADTDAPTAVLDVTPSPAFAGRTVTLSGARSFDTGGGRITQYTWSAPLRPAASTAFPGPVVTDTSTFTFTPDKAGAWNLQLVVMDDSGNASAPVQFQLTVNALDTTAPTAVLTAPATGKVGVTLTLNGTSSSDVGGNIVQYRWSATERPAGSTVLPGPVVTTAPTLAITPDKLGRYIVQLVVVDDSGNQSAPGSATILVADTDAPTPVLDVTPSPAFTGRTVTLSGARSSDTGGGRIIQYTWSALSRPAGSTAFPGPVVTDTSTFTFTPDKAGTWQLRLVVRDDSGNVSAPADAALLVSNPVLDPAGDEDGDGIPNGVELEEGLDPLTKDNDVFRNPRLFAMQQYRDFLAREGDAGGIKAWQAYLDGGGSRATATEGFFGSSEFQGMGSPVVRLYFAYFLRIPDYGGLTFWMDYFRAGNPLVKISNAFAGSKEFVDLYGALSNAAFVDLVYENVLNRAPDAGGKAFWVGQLNGGMSRGEMMVGFSESAEFQKAIFSETYVTMMYVGMLKRAPDSGGFAFWVNYVDKGNSGEALISGFLNATEYHGRFLP